jgi:hypothetical protein
MHFGNGAATRCRDVAPEVGGARCSDLNTTRFLRRVIEAERPDLIAFTGAFFPLLSPLRSWWRSASRLLIWSLPISGGPC